MAVRNDTDHQYVNGSLGTVRGFTTQSQGGWPIVEFGKRQHRHHEAEFLADAGRRYRARHGQTGAVALRVGDHHPQIARHDARSCRHGFATHIRAGHGYVALSRVEGLDGLYLQGVNERMFLVSPDAVRLDGQLRLESAQAADTLASDGVGAFRARMPQPAAGEDDEFAQDVLF